MENENTQSPEEMGSSESAVTLKEDRPGDIPIEPLTVNPSEHIRGVIEALLFVNERPVTLEQIKNVLGPVALAEIKNMLKFLEKESEDRKSGMIVREIAGGYQMLTNPVYASYVRDFYKIRHKEKLSKPALETLAIIAYKQPVTRTDIELIRGVNSDGVVAHLLGKELIKEAGRKDVPGRPFLYGTTKQFLEYFGLKSLYDLPKLEEFPGLADKVQANLPPPSSEMAESPSVEKIEAPLEDTKPRTDVPAFALPETQTATPGEVV